MCKHCVNQMMQCVADFVRFRSERCVFKHNIYIQSASVSPAALDRPLLAQVGRITIGPFVKVLYSNDNLPIIIVSGGATQ